MTPDDIALLQYTGGMTGVSKGAELRHRNLTANIRQLDQLVFSRRASGEFSRGAPALSCVWDDGHAKYLSGRRRMYGAGP